MQLFTNYSFYPSSLTFLRLSGSVTVVSPVWIDYVTCVTTFKVLLRTISVCTVQEKPLYPGESPGTPCSEREVPLESCWGRGEIRDREAIPVYFGHGWANPVKTWITGNVSGFTCVFLTGIQDVQHLLLNWPGGTRTAFYSSHCSLTWTWGG